jgi:hypothetical protein
LHCHNSLPCFSPPGALVGLLFSLQALTTYWPSSLAGRLEALLLGGVEGVQTFPVSGHQRYARASFSTAAFTTEYCLLLLLLLLIPTIWSDLQCDTSESSAPRIALSLSLATAAHTQEYERDNSSPCCVPSLSNLSLSLFATIPISTCAKISDRSAARQRQSRLFLYMVRSSSTISAEEPHHC